MYLKGSNWSMNKRRKPLKIGRILILAVLIGGLVYINQVIVRQLRRYFSHIYSNASPESYITEARVWKMRENFRNLLPCTIRLFNQTRKIRLRM